MKDRSNRAQGALMGAFIGEALGVGPHWYYNLDKLHEEYGTWIDDYTNPKDDRYHHGVKAGELSQQGWIIKEMATYLVEHEGYEQESFCEMMDTVILPKVSAEPMGGLGGYTSQVMRHLYMKRVEKKLPWSEVAGIGDTTESLERNIPTAIYYANDMAKLCESISDNTALAQSDNVTGSLSVAFNVVLATLIQGEPLDGDISKKLMDMVHDGTLPFHAVTLDGLEAPAIGERAKPVTGLFASPDALLSPGYMARAANDPDIVIEPAWKASIVYGMPCAIYHMLPASYYLAARFHDDFEQGVLHAINGGGQNQVRAMLTGALIGAQVGLDGIPKRFIEGLKDHEQLLELAAKLQPYKD